MYIATFRLLTAGLPQAMVLSDYAVPFNFCITMVGCDWCISILTVPVRQSSCSLGSPLMCFSPVVFSNRGHPRIRKFSSTVSVDVVMAKSHVDSFLDPTGVSV